MIFACTIASGQLNDQNSRQDVLKKGIADTTFIFGKWTKQGNTETHLRYLGQVETKDGRIFKIMTSIWIWGLAQRATSRILVFNGKNKYVGNYYMAIVSDLPTKLSNGKLIFKNEGEDCDKNIETVIDLRNGLPKQFFRKCQGESGDIYTFESD